MIVSANCQLLWNEFIPPLGSLDADLSPKMVSAQRWMFTKSDLILQQSNHWVPFFNHSFSRYSSKSQPPLNGTKKSLESEKYLTAHEVSEKGRNAGRAEELVTAVIPNASARGTPSNLQAPCETCHKAQDYQLTRVWVWFGFSLSTSFSHIFLVSKQHDFHRVSMKHSPHPYNLPWLSFNSPLL